MYVIRKISDCCLFYVDRSITKKFWWSYSLKFAMKFRSREVAQQICDKLKYGKCIVITLDEARELRKLADQKHEERVDFAKRKIFENIEDGEHPFSSEALGQW